MGSSSSPSTSTSSIVTAPTSWIQPYQAFGAQEASRLYRDSGTTPLMNDAGNYLQRLVSGNAGQGYSGPTNQFAMGALGQDSAEFIKRFAAGNAGQGYSGPTNQFAMGDPSVATKIDQSLTDTAGGQYLNSNPYLDTMFASASRPVVDNIQSQFSRAGRYGSAANQDVLGRSLGELSSNIYGQNYARERQNQLSAGNAITGFSAADRQRQLQANDMMNQIYTNNANRELQASGMMSQVFSNNANRQLQANDMMNQFYTNNANRQLQGLLFAPQFNQEQSGQSALGRYLQAINGMNVGQSTSGSQTVPYYSNPVGQGIGMATAGLQGLTYANNLFGGAPANYLSSLWGGGGGGVSVGMPGAGYSWSDIGSPDFFSGNVSGFS